MSSEYVYSKKLSASRDGRSSFSSRKARVMDQHRPFFLQAVMFVIL